MDIKRTLQNPFALIAQGFVAGALLFWVTLPDAPAQDGAAPVLAASAAQKADG
jgi:hypothetical protein